MHPLHSWNSQQLAPLAWELHYCAAFSWHMLPTKRGFSILAMFIRYWTNVQKTGNWRLWALGALGSWELWAHGSFLTFRSCNQLSWSVAVTTYTYLVAGGSLFIHPQIISDTLDCPGLTSGKAILPTQALIPTQFPRTSDWLHYSCSTRSLHDVDLTLNF